MIGPLKTFWAAVVEYYYDLPRMVAVNLLWFLTALPALFVWFAIWQLTSEMANRPMMEAIALLVRNVWIVPIVVIALALAGPGTAAVNYVMNRLANGELLEIGRFWYGFRHYFWRGWGLATLDLGAGALLLLNIAFYWAQGNVGLKVVAIVFAYLLVIWFAVQGYLFSLLVELDQSLRLVIRNALFLTIDNLGLTLGLTLANLFIVAISLPVVPTPLLPFASMVLAANTNNKVIVETVQRYRESGRMIKES